jgi:cation diffusion facilitator family transporter
MNLFLAVVKITAGIIAHAHAVMLDGVNSLSDMVSSLLTILSSYIAGKRGTRDHPLGYGRLEYISSFVVTVIIMYVGVRTLIEAVKTIIHPHDPPKYSVLVAAIMLASLVCKILYGVSMRKNGRRLDSEAMIMTGTESLGDALISVAILAAIVVYRLTGVDVEHYLCIIISLMILRTGAEMIKDCVDKMLGTRLADDERKRIAAIAAGFDEVLHVSNLMMHNYGENIYVGSLDIAVDEKLTAVEVSRLSRRIIRKAEEQGVTLTSVGISGVNTTDPGAVAIMDEIIDAARKYEGLKQLHSFDIDAEENILSFTAVPDYSAADRDGYIRMFTEEIRSMYPEMTVDIRTGIDM